MNLDALIARLTRLQELGHGHWPVVGLPDGTVAPPLTIADVTPERHDVGGTVWLNLEST